MAANHISYDAPIQAKEKKPRNQEMVPNSTVSREPFSKVKSEPITGRDHVRLRPIRLKELILENEITMKIAPTLLIVSGLPNSQKTTAIQQMLEDIHLRSFDDQISAQEEDGVGFYEVLAARNAMEDKKKIIFAPSDRNRGYPSVIYSGVERVVRLSGRKLTDVEYDTFFEFSNSDLNKHFRTIFKDLYELHFQKNIIPSEWDRSHPNGLALINIWDIGLSKVATYILPRLSGLLCNSHVWMFLDLLRDIDRLYEVPDLPENRVDKTRNDKELIMKWRSRIRYLLRFAKLTSAPGMVRHDVGTIIASLTSTPRPNQDVSAMIEKLSKTVKTVSKNMKIDDLVDTEDIRLLKSFSNEIDDLLKKLLEKIIHDGLSNPVNVPLSFVLLRSMFYKRDDLYISKEKLREISAELIPSSQSFNEFCHQFTSFGSIIDMSLIDPTNNTIILKPVHFLNELDKLFYYKGDDPLVTQYGLVTEANADSIFGRDKHVFMSFLESLHFAIEVSPTQCNIPFTGSFIYYVPNVCTVPPDLHCSPTALHFIRDVNVPLSYFKVVFSSTFLEENPIARLEMSPTDSKINVTRFRSNDVVFELVYFGDSIEFRFQDPLNKEVCRQIIRTCNKIMEDQECKYNFAIMCSSHNNVCGSENFRHLLPFQDDCQCRTEDSLAHISVWNAILGKITVPKERILNGGYNCITPEDIAHISKELAQLSNNGAEYVIAKLGGKEKEGDWMYFMKLVLNWIEPRQKSKSKLAVMLNSLAVGTDNGSDKGILESDKGILGSDKGILESLASAYLDQK